MKIYILSSLIEDIKKTDFYKSKTPKQQNLIIKRCCVFIHILHQHNVGKKSLKQYTQVGLSSTLLSELLGSGYKQILKLLKEIGFINMDPWLIKRRRVKVETEFGYYYLPNLKRYWLTSKAKDCSVETIELQDSKYEKEVVMRLAVNYLTSEVRLGDIKPKPLF